MPADNPHQLARLDIPATYLDDTRAAIIQMIVTDSVGLQGAHRDMLEAEGAAMAACHADYASVYDDLRSDIRLLDQLADTPDGSATLHDTGGHLAYLLGLINEAQRDQLARSAPALPHARCGR